MSTHRFTLRFAIPLLLAIAAAAPLSAQTAGTTSSALSERLMIVPRSNDRAMVTIDGGSSWRLVSRQEASRIRSEYAAGRLTVSQRNGNAESITATIGPNPATTQATISVSGTDGSTLTLMLVDARGDEVLQRAVETEGGSTTVQLDTSRLASGTYYVRLGNGKGIVSTGTLVVAH